MPDTNIAYFVGGVLCLETPELHLTYTVFFLQTQTYWVTSMGLTG